MSFLERFSAHVTAKLVVLFASSLTRRVKVTLVLRTHVVDEVGRHAEARVALGTPVLHELHRRKRRRQGRPDAVRRLRRGVRWSG